MFGWLCLGGVGGFQQNMRDMWVMCDFLCWPSFVWLDWCYFWSQEPYEPDWSERVCEWMQKQRPQWICEDIWPMMVSRNVKGYNKSRKRDMKRSHVKPPPTTHPTVGCKTAIRIWRSILIIQTHQRSTSMPLPLIEDKSRPPNTAPATKSDNSTLLWSTLLVQSLYIGNVLTKIPLTIYYRFNCISYIIVTEHCTTLTFVRTNARFHLESRVASHQTGLLCIKGLRHMSQRLTLHPTFP